MPRNPLHTKLISIVEPVLNAAGYDLVELRFLLEQGGWTLRIAIDLPLDADRPVDEVPEDRVDLSDCADMSRELSAVLDVEDPITQAYSLEVSSPGIDRALRTPNHFEHFVGAEAKIAMAVPLVVDPNAAVAERKNFRGILRGVEAGEVIIEVDGKPFRLPIDDIDTARLIPDWDAVMRGKSGVGTPSPAAKPGAKPAKANAKAKHKPAKQAPPGDRDTADTTNTSTSHAVASQRGGDTND